LISRADLERLLRSDGGASKPTLAEWLNEVQQSGLKAAATAASAADLVLVDRMASVGGDRQRRVNLISTLATTPAASYSGRQRLVSTRGADAGGKRKCG